MMETRNHRYTATGSIDCDVNHPVHGWIPFTADPGDGEPFAKQVWAAVHQRTDILPFEPAPAQTVEQWRLTAALLRADFVNAAADLGMLTDDEAIEAARGGWPLSFDSAIAGLSPTDQRKAKVLWAGVTDIQRNADLIALIIASPIPITEAQVDALFGWTG